MPAVELTLPAGPQEIGAGYGRSECCVIALEEPPGKSQQHEEYDFGGSSGDPPKSQARYDQNDRDESTEQTCSLAFLDELPEAGQKGRAESRAVIGHGTGSGLGAHC